MYCCNRCKDNASKIRRGIQPVYEITRTCLECNQVFTTVYKKTIFCSRKCADKHRYIPHPKPIKEPKQKPPIQTEYRVCVVCGNVFECDIRLMNKTCSHECSVENKRRKINIKSRNREKRIAKVLVDKDISLETLVRRDNNICWICGEQCDLSDKRIVNGTIIVGDTYPSIDHLLPIARGGRHEWENIRLAHKGCNSLRGATLCDSIDEMTKEEARKYARQICQNKKEVIQYLNGVEYARYESTAQASRITGFKQKGIQNACRGDGTGKNKSRPIDHKMYGYEWKYIG